MCYAVCILMLFVFSLSVGSDLSHNHRFNVRLLYGNRTKDVFSGIIQLYNQEKRKWVFGCDSMSQNAIHAICRELKYDNGRALLANFFDRRFYLHAKLYNLDCSNDAENTSQCNQTIASKCYVRAGLACWNRGAKLEKTVELDTLYGTENFGIVRLNIYGTTGYGCPKYLDDQNAAVFCRAANFMGGYLAFSHSDPRYDNVKYLTYSLQCDKNSSDILDCPMLGSFCYTPNKVLTVYCYRDERHMIIVSDGENKNKGEVRLKIGNKWGRVCMSNKKQKFIVAGIACRQMGYAHGVPARPVAVGSEKHMWFSGLFCRHDDTSLFHCNFTSLEATDEECLTSPLHVSCFERVLIGRGYDSSGTVRVYDPYVLRYRFVCLEGFSDMEATAICKGNGYKYGKTVKGSNADIQPVDGMVLDQLECPKTASSITDCGSVIGYCWSAQYVSVACSDLPYLEDGNYTLDLSGKSQGVVRLTHFNNAGFICGDGFDDAAATVVCREMDPTYYIGVAFQSNETERYRRLVWLRDLNCTGNEWKISACNHSKWGDATGCGDLVAGVMCYSTNKSTSRTRETPNMTKRAGETTTGVHATALPTANPTILNQKTSGTTRTTPSKTTMYNGAFRNSRADSFVNFLHFTNIIIITIMLMY